jgi:adenylate cyclase
VKGKANACLVFELLGRADVARGPEIAAYEDALEDYFGRRFREASEALARFAALDPPSKVLLERCRNFLETPPPPEWDGAWIARSK